MSEKRAAESDSDNHCERAVRGGGARECQSDHVIMCLIHHSFNILSIYLSIYLKKLEYHEKGQYFLSLISESETQILNRFITQSEIFQAFISWNFDDFGLPIMKTKNSVSENLNIT